ncbi:hypothetical protein [Marininema halotolerans]|uniref:Uncharacterized protein n=1 Tax=Marininema halotolerans TaxID=1155944 RepID=A0A1I6SK69_9BACL|nr:hypothetical protein [Marininema halotolerans]SFS77319.1 hypothetical protein SAMN05444972_107156 [Marininema halotolerans]
MKSKVSKQRQGRGKVSRFGGSPTNALIASLVAAIRATFSYGDPIAVSFVGGSDIVGTFVSVSDGVLVVNRTVGEHTGTALIALADVDVVTKG